VRLADGSYPAMAGFTSLFGKKGGHPPIDATKKINETTTTTTAAETSSSSTSSESESAGCPVKKNDGASSSRSWNIFKRGGPGPGSDGLKEDSTTVDGNDGSTSSASSSSTLTTTTTTRRQQQYDVYSRPLPMDPTNNMPLANPIAAARNSLPSPDQSTPLPTERVSSTIPKGGAGDSGATWTYPSPQMFYNALSRKGKLGDTKEEDLVSVVAIHNCMNEGTWERILQWEKVLHDDGSGNDDGSDASKTNAVPKTSLTKFLGRPTDLSPKAYFKHYFLNHPLPFDRHDWTVTRANADGSSSDVRYVIDYYHDETQANEEEGSGMPDMRAGIGPSEGSALRSLLVDVRPAADGVGELWGRLVSMPLARRGCRSMLECVLFKGEGSGRRSEFEPLPLAPSEGLKTNVEDSIKVWDNIQKSAAAKSEKEVEKEEATTETTTAAPAAISKTEAAEVASSFSKILSSCRDRKADLQSCDSDEECKRAFMGMTVCAGQFMCPLQHSSLMASLENHSGEANDEMVEAKIDTAFQVLGECVANYDKRAKDAREQFPEVFDEALKKG